MDSEDIEETTKNIKAMMNKDNLTRNCVEEGSDTKKADDCELQEEKSLIEEQKRILKESKRKGSININDPSNKRPVHTVISGRRIHRCFPEYFHRCFGW